MERIFKLTIEGNTHKHLDDKIIDAIEHSPLPIDGEILFCEEITEKDEDA